VRPVSADSRQFPYTLEAAIAGLALAHGGAPVSGRVRARAGDFLVTELPLVEPAGEGEHAWLLVRKREENTATVAGQLAQLAGVPLRNVGYAGLKDRNAVTEQWFSVHLPGRAEPDWKSLDSDRITLLQHTRHTRKLRRGALQGNAFSLRLRELSGDIDVLQTRLRQVATEGVPNYFGEQRFGRGGSNLVTAARLFAGSARRLSRHQRGLALSAARAFLFNRVLGWRVAAGNWNRLLAGEAVQLAGSHSFFLADTIDAELLRRLQHHDIHPTGPMAGKGEPPVSGECRQLEGDCLAPCTDWLQGLVAAGLKQERRALRVVPDNVTWSWPQADELLLEFSLPAGSYATSVLRELVRNDVPDQDQGLIRMANAY
jgi:tRNA pseudouridine13 synthase